MKSRTVLIVVVLCLLSAASWRVYGNYAKANANTGKPVKAIATVEVRKTEIGPIAASLQITGTVQGVQEATIAAKTSGRIQYLGVSDGTFVTLGKRS